MKKYGLFFISVIVAVAITLYTKRVVTPMEQAQVSKWNTYVKKANQGMASYESTEEELIKAKLSKPSKQHRTPASIGSERFYSFRDNRVLQGDEGALDPKYLDPKTPLPMINKVSKNWRDEMGKDLMRFQNENTKVMVHDEFSVIRIVDDQGQFLQQVAITYLLPTGERNSFRALIDSESGMILETWDRSLGEKTTEQKEKISFPSAQNAQYFIK